MNTVLLAAPLIVFALVVLFGFAGCWLDTEGVPGEEPTRRRERKRNGNGPDGEWPAARRPTWTWS